MFTVNDMLYDLDGHNGEHEIKIKLDDGTIKEIDGIQFRNIIADGDDVLYIKELTPLRKRFQKEIEIFLDNIEGVIKNLKIIDNACTKNNANFDSDFIYEIMVCIARTCDWYFKALQLDIRYDIGCGSDKELKIKLDVLRTWLNRGKIPKDITEIKG